MTYDKRSTAILFRKFLKFTPEGTHIDNSKPWYCSKQSEINDLPQQFQIETEKPRENLKNRIFPSQPPLGSHERYPLSKSPSLHSIPSFSPALCLSLDGSQSFVESSSQAVERGSGRRKRWASDGGKRQSALKVLSRYVQNGVDFRSVT